MKITEVRTHLVSQELQTPFGMSQWHWTTRASCLVEISTDDGLTGWGECFGPAEPNQALIDSTYQPLIIGDDPRESQAVWEKLYNRSREWGRKGIAITALSGIEIALLDLTGKALGVPVYRLLGGSPHPIDCYASAFYYDGPWDNDFVGEAHHLQQRGFTAFKMKVGADLATDVDRVRRVRAAIGPQAQLAVDANRGYSYPEAIRFIDATSPEGLWFFEEPLIPEDLAGYGNLRLRSSVPIAGGESEFTRWGFRDLINSHSVDILQPDATACGGIRETLLIAGMASTQGIETVPHVWGSAITLAAALHIFTALPTVSPSRGRSRPRLELDQAPNALREELSDLTTGPVMQVPDAPGLGIEIDGSVLRRYQH